jgi:hypothetical protein
MHRLDIQLDLPSSVLLSYFLTGWGTTLRTGGNDGTNKGMNLWEPPAVHRKHHLEPGPLDINTSATQSALRIATTSPTGLRVA